MFGEAGSPLDDKDDKDRMLDDITGYDRVHRIRRDGGHKKPKRRMVESHGKWLQMRYRWSLSLDTRLGRVPPTGLGYGINCERGLGFVRHPISPIRYRCNRSGFLDTASPPRACSRLLLS